MSNLNASQTEIIARKGAEAGLSAERVQQVIDTAASYIVAFNLVTGGPSVSDQANSDRAYAAGSRRARQMGHHGSYRGQTWDHA